MIFNAAAKAQLLALVNDLEPTPEINPLQEQLDAANQTITQLNHDLAVMTEERNAALGKIEAARTALA